MSAPTCLSCRRPLEPVADDLGDLELRLDGSDLVEVARDMLREKPDEATAEAISTVLAGLCRVCGRPYPAAAR